MMITPTGITISFGGTPGGGDDSRPVVARIIGMAGDDAEPVSYEMVVPAGGSIEQLLPEGLYNVQLTLPSGRLIQRNVKIDEDTHETYKFFEDFTAGAGFSLQESVGRADQDILADAATASGNTSSAEYSEALSRAADIARAQPGKRGFAPGGRRFRVNPPIDLPAPPRQATLEEWAGPVDLGTGEPVDSGAARPLAPVELHGDSGLWRIHHDDIGSLNPSSRRWAKIELPGGGVELASLPLPWFCTGTGDYSPAELLVDPARSDGAATTVAIRDARLGGLLAFLDRGQASSAGPMLAELERENVIEQTISSKMSNPLAACAAAYVGLAVYPHSEHEQWDTWLGNCMDRFPGVPDAAIVHARRLVLRPTDRDDNALAAEALRQACRAGVPFFSCGVLLLREMLLMLSADHEDLGPLGEQAAMLAGRVDPRQAFTVLRYAPAKARAK